MEKDNNRNSGSGVLGTIFKGAAIGLTAYAGYKLCEKVEEYDNFIQGNGVLQ